MLLKHNLLRCTVAKNDLLNTKALNLLQCWNKDQKLAVLKMGYIIGYYTAVLKEIWLIKIDFGQPNVGNWLMAHCYI